MVGALLTFLDVIGSILVYDKILVFHVLNLNIKKYAAESIERKT